MATRIGGRGTSLTSLPSWKSLDLHLQALPQAFTGESAEIQGRGILQTVKHLCATRPSRDKTGFSEHLQMLADTWLMHLHQGADLLYRFLVSLQHMQNAQPGWFAKNPKTGRDQFDRRHGLQR